MTPDFEEMYAWLAVDRWEKKYKRVRLRDRPRLLNFTYRCTPYCASVSRFKQIDSGKIVTKVEVHQRTGKPVAWGQFVGKRWVGRFA